MANVLIADKKKFIFAWPNWLKSKLDELEAGTDTKHQVGAAVLKFGPLAVGTILFMTLAPTLFFNPFMLIATGIGLVFSGLGLYLAIDKIEKNQASYTGNAKYVGWMNSAHQFLGFTKSDKFDNVAKILTSKKFYQDNKHITVILGIGGLAMLPILGVLALVGLASYGIAVGGPMLVASLVAGGAWVVEKMTGLCDAKPPKPQQRTVISAAPQGEVAMSDTFGQERRSPTGTQRPVRNSSAHARQTSTSPWGGTTAENAEIDAQIRGVQGPADRKSPPRRFGHNLSRRF